MTLPDVLLDAAPPMTAEQVQGLATAVHGLVPDRVALRLARCEVELSSSGVTSMPFVSAGYVPLVSAAGRAYTASVVATPGRALVDDVHTRTGRAPAARARQRLTGEVHTAWMAPEFALTRALCALEVAALTVAFCLRRPHGRHASGAVDLLREQAAALAPLLLTGRAADVAARLADGWPGTLRELLRTARAVAAPTAP